MNISITEDINGQKYVRAEQEQKGLPLSQRFKDWQFIQEPKKGYWRMENTGYWRCSVCSDELDAVNNDGSVNCPIRHYVCKFKYCPNCGARMEESEEA